jgi:hypothetical protein
MAEDSLGDLRGKLAALEAEESRVSAERRHLHRQIDFGYASETARTREREVSDRRRELHRLIDELRKQLGMPVGPQRVPAQSELERVGGDSSIGGLERIGDEMQDMTPPADPHVM